MNEEWPTVKLGDVVEITSSKRIKMADYVDNGVPFYRSKEIIERAKGNNISTELFISEDHFNAIDKKFGSPSHGDILLTSVGTLGVPYRVKLDDHFYFKDGNLTWFRNYKKNVDDKFLFCWLTSPMAKHKFDEVTIGSTQKALTIISLKSIELLLPPLTEQKAIASVLGVLDDKIQNNHQMNETLEEMARVIFKNWFVDFEPIYAKAAGNTPSNMNAKTAALFPSSFSDDGLPIKWEQRKVSKFAKAVLGGTPSRNNPTYWGGDIPWINSGAVNKFRILEATELITKDGLMNSSTKLLPINTTVIAITGATLGQVSYLEIETCANQSVVGVIPNKKYANEWVYLSILSNIDRLTNLQTGGAQQHINKNNVLNFNVLYPTDEIILSFSEIVRPLFKKIANSLRENKTLSELRDTLLPKLMSGEICLKDAESEVEAAL